MRFSIEDAVIIPSITLVYRPMDHAFDVEPKPLGGGASLLVNDLQLELDEDGRVLYAWGLCPQTSWTEEAGEPPRARRAVLVAQLPADFSPGMSMRLNTHLWPVTVDRRSGWVRVGGTHESDDAVEFALGMVATFLDRQLVGVWLRPRELP